MWGRLVVVAVLAAGCSSQSLFDGRENRTPSQDGATTGAICGDGFIDPEETCDPPGSCPVCDDGNACTADSMTGAADTCDVQCTRAPVTACSNADGCCPAGCNTSNDDDCSQSCGDSIVDANETCDPPSTCPTACNDGEACTGDLLTGSASNCNAQCATSPVNACSDGDACCPGGCTSATDNDCNPACGNGVVEMGETCDPVSSCPMSCNDGDACTADMLMGSSTTCTAACTYSAITACTDGDGCCPTGCTSLNDTDCSPMCGNDAIEMGETCDPISSCPTACNDNNACTTNVLTGSAATCNAACTYPAITACTDGDSCCPSSCTSLNDTDCSPMCGNGVVEGGETCDPVSSCPTACNDSNACTMNVLTGSASNCNAVCSYPAITTCTDGDACCPSSCTSLNDTDCSPMCGNGAVEGGETCDPVSSCPTACNDNNACTTNVLMGSASNCNAVCSYPAITACTDGDACCPSSCTSLNDSDCSPMCGNGAVEGGETCDPVSSCPTACNDNNACTTNVLTGSPAACTAACTYPAITACTDGDSCCPSGCTIVNDDDCTPTNALLQNRLVVTSVAAPAGVIPGVSNWRIWGTSSLAVGPVYTVPYADCGTLIGYTTGTTTNPRARVARLDANDQLVTTYDLGAFTVRGLAAEPDGHWAALLWEQKANPDTNQLHVRRYSAAFVQQFSTPLPNNQVAPDDFGIGESRLEFSPNTNRYGAYFHVHGVDPTYFAYGHEGDMLQWVDKTTGALTLGWTWGCSHSMSNLLRYSPAANLTLPICATDCYPGTSGSPFSETSIGGIYLNHSERKVRDFDAGCNGRVAAEIGGAAPGAAGWKLVFNGHQNAATLGQSSYSTTTMNQDIGFQAIANTKALSGSIVWLTTTPGNERNASIARWKPTGDTTEQYVVGWSDSSTPAVFKLARVTAAGAFLEGPTTITTAKWGHRDDPFREHRNGDIVWAWFDSAGSSTLRFARLVSGGTASCSP